MKLQRYIFTLVNQSSRYSPGRTWAWWCDVWCGGAGLICWDEAARSPVIYLSPPSWPLLTRASFQPGGQTSQTNKLCDHIAQLLTTAHHLQLLYVFPAFPPISGTREPYPWGRAVIDPGPWHKPPVSLSVCVRLCMLWLENARSDGPRAPCNASSNYREVAVIRDVFSSVLNASGHLLVAGVTLPLFGYIKSRSPLATLYTISSNPI